MVAHPNYIRGGGAAWEVAMVVAMENEVNDYFRVVEGAQATGRRRSMPCSRTAIHARWLNLLQLTAPRSKSAVAVKMTARANPRWRR